MENSNYLKQQLHESLKVINTCVASIYNGEFHMYRPLACQLRILLCDRYRQKDNSLLTAVFPEIDINPLKQILWSNEQSSFIELRHTTSNNAKIATMPFEVSLYFNGLVVADLQFDQTKFIPISEFSAQLLTVYPVWLTVFDVIRTVADKGGGAHVDANSSLTLRYLYKKYIYDVTYAQIFILALGRFVLRLGEKLMGYKGCRVPSEVYQHPIQKRNLLMVAHQDWIDANSQT